MAWKEIASGQFASEPRELEGPVRIVCGLDQIVAFMKEPIGEPSIIITNVAGGSAVSTIIKRAMGIVSTIGGPLSHIVVVAKDYGVPCIVGASELPISDLRNGDRMRLYPNGRIEIQHAE